MTWRDWVARIIALAVGWRLAMAYPLDDSLPSLLLSLALGTAGVVWVAAISYFAGREDGKHLPPRPGGAEE